MSMRAATCGRWGPSSMSCSPARAHFRPAMISSRASSSVLIRRRVRCEPRCPRVSRRSSNRCLSVEADARFPSAAESRSRAGAVRTAAYQVSMSSVPRGGSRTRARRPRFRRSHRHHRRPRCRRCMASRSPPRRPAPRARVGGRASPRSRSASRWCRSQRWPSSSARTSQRPPRPSPRSRPPRCRPRPRLRPRPPSFRFRFRVLVRVLVRRPRRQPSPAAPAPRSVPREARRIGRRRRPRCL